MPKRKKILFFSQPLWGHMNPTYDLFQEIMSTYSAEVVYVSTDTFESRIHDIGASYMPYESTLKLEAFNKGLTYTLRKNNFFGVIQTYCQFLPDIMPYVLEMIEREQPDLIVYDSGALWGRIGAIHHRIPYMQSNTMFSMHYSVFLGSKHLWKDFVKVAVRHQPSFLKSLPTLLQTFREYDPFDESLNRGNIVYTSRSFQPHDRACGPAYYFIGPKHVEGKYKKVSQAQNKRIYVSLGTYMHENKQFFKVMSRVASKRPDMQFVISWKGWQQQGVRFPDNVSLHDFVNQKEELCKADMFITCGGMNSVHEAIQIGTPLIIVPQIFEQSIVAHQCVEHGVGVLNDQYRLTTKGLLKNIDEVYEQYDELSVNLQKCSSMFEEQGERRRLMVALEALL